MVSIKNVRVSNEALKNSPPGLVAVFVGATGGIASSTLKQLALHANAPIVYLVGRSKAKAAPLLAELQKVNPQATFNFIEGEVSLVKEVDKVCDQIVAKEQKLDLLFVATGLLALGGREETSEGIALIPAVAYYCRQRFVNNLLPLLAKSPSPRVVTILGAGKEDKLVTSDLELASPENYTLTNALNHTGTMTTLAFDELAKANPKISFVHKYPGLVSTGLMKKMFSGWTGIRSIVAILVRNIVLPIAGLFQISPVEAGERGLFAATSGNFKEGGAYRLDWNDDLVKEPPILKQYREEGMAKKVWEHTVGVWDRVLSRS